MEIKIYNTLAREKQTFKPQKMKEVSMYHCGPTVYNTPHIGNYRTFITNDWIRRVFEYNGYKVHQAMNITDIDDKTISGSKKENLPLKEFTSKYEKLFLEEIDSLNILRPEYLTRATEYIDSMIEMVEELIKKDLAYKAKDGIYLSISKIKDYGKLAQLDLSKITKERIHNDEYDKDNPRDFSLWKFTTKEDGETYYETSFGRGRPGWHIECSSMSMKVLGETIDIHTGGSDLIFPHHTNEIAQSEAYSGKEFVRYWMHIAFVNIANEKMAKSKGNFFKLEDLKEKAVSPLGYRYWLLTANYRSTVNFTFEAVTGAQNALIRLMKTVVNYPDNGKIIAKYREKFLEFINNDLDLPQAVALVWELISDHSENSADKKATILDFDKVFGLRLDSIPKSAKENLPPEIEALIEARNEARKEKDWVKADALRNEIVDRGYSITDK